MKKYTLSLLTLSMALSSGAAFAAYTVGDPLPQTVSIPFVAPSIVAHNITPVSGLQAGSLTPGTVVANGAVTMPDDVDYVIVEPTNHEAYSKQTGGGYIRADFPGVNNTIALRIAGGTSLGTGEQGRLKLDGPGKSFEYTITTHSSNPIAADVYTVAISAQRWMN